MKTLTLLLAALLVMPFAVFAEPAATNCEKDHTAAVVVPKKKVAKKKQEPKTPPVAFVAPPEKEVVEKEVPVIVEKEVIVTKEVPVIVEKEVVVEKQVIVQVPVPVAAPAAPVAQPVVRKRPHHVDATHPLDTDGLASAPVNPQSSALNNVLSGAAVTGAIVYGMSR